MIVASYVTSKQNLSETKTYEDYYKFLGAKPERLGIMARMYPKLTVTFLTEALKNVFEVNQKKEQFKSLEAPYFEWDTEVNFIKRIAFAAVPTEVEGEITMYFSERYYEKYDIFKIDKTRQQCIVICRPIRRADDLWEYTVRLVDNDFASTLNLDGCQIGDTTRFQSVAMPELHNEGHIKYQSNISTHRNYIQTFRVDVSYSAEFAATEDVFVQIASGKDTKSLSPVVYKMDKKEKQLLENFLYVRDNGIMFNRTNMDKNGKATIQDPNTQRPIIITDGVLPQVERFCGKYVFNKLTINVFQKALSDMVSKADNPTGNKFLFIVNEQMWNEVNSVLSEYLSRFKPASTYMYSASKGGYIKVGNTFNGYEIAGNEVSFNVDRSLSYEYPYQSFGLCLDLTADATTGNPAMQMFTLKNSQFISNKLAGVGGLDGVSSGAVASPVAGSRLINWGMAGVGVFNPYRSYMLMGQINY